MLSRKATGQIFDEAMDLFVTRVLSCIPSDANINIFQQDSHGLFPRKLMEALDFVRKESQQDPRNEFKATLKVELSLFVHGRSEQLKRDYEESIRELPQCVDVHWQHIRSENNSETQMKLIVDLLSRIAQARTSVNTEQSNKISGMTLEILIRFLRMPNGMSKVLKILTNNDDDDIIETKSVQLFSMEETTGIYLTEQDKYLIWMVILYYYVTKTIPDNICQNWMDKLVKTGKASTEKPMFMIDWTPTLENKPLDRQSQIGCVNILLSMLRHFGNKACNDISRRPLLIGVLRTLLNLLPFSPSYKLAGTLILTRKALQLKSLQPEMQEIVIELELKAKNNIVFSVMIEKVSKLFYRLSLGYQIASRMPCKNNEREDLYKIASILGSCIGYQANENDDLVIRVDKIRQSYLSLLGLDTLNIMLDQQKWKTNTRQMKSCSFAWLNLLVLLQISKLLYIENTVIRDTLLNQIDLVLNGARDYIKSKEGIAFIQDYAHIIKNT